MVVTREWKGLRPGSWETGLPMSRRHVPKPVFIQPAAMELDSPTVSSPKTRVISVLCLGPESAGVKGTL